MRRDRTDVMHSLGLLAICGVLGAAYTFQLALNELPCPLCLLQRVTFSAVAFGLLLNVRYGARMQHYGIMLAGALFGMAVSGRQVLLHIAPGTGAYGSAFLGLHFYTWAFLLFAAIIVGTAGLLLLEPEGGTAEPRGGRWLPRLAAYCAIALTLANAATTFIQCGPIECSDNPVHYSIATDVVK